MANSNKSKNKAKKNTTADDTESQPLKLATTDDDQSARNARRKSLLEKRKSAVNGNQQTPKRRRTNPPPPPPPVTPENLSPSDVQAADDSTPDGDQSATNEDDDDSLESTTAHRHLDLIDFNPDKEVEKDHGFVLEALDHIAQSPTTAIPVDRSLCPPAELRVIEREVVRKTNKTTGFKASRKKKDRADTEMHGKKILLLSDYGGLERHRARFDDFPRYASRVDEEVLQHIFKYHKFPMSTYKEQSLVLRLVDQGHIKDFKYLGRQATKEEIAVIFHLQLRKKIQKMRNGSVQLVRGKFLADKTRRPANFLSKLTTNYRQYFDSNKKLKPGMKPFWDAFCYFVIRVLSSVNARHNKFGEQNKMNRMTLLISDVFTVPDEAFALAMILNCYARWVKEERYKAADGDVNKQTFYKSPGFDALFSSSAYGRKDQAWSDQGLSTYNHFCELVAARRTGTADTPDVVDEMFRKRYAASLGYRLDEDSVGPIGVARLDAIGDEEPVEVVEAWVPPEEEEDIERYGQMLSQA